MRPLTSLIVTIIVLFFLPLEGFGKEIQFVGELKVDPAIKLPSTIVSIAKSDDGLIFIPGEGCINVLKNQEGTLRTILTLDGQHGKEMLVRPKYLTYEATGFFEGKLGVIDYGAKKIFVFTRIGPENFLLTETIPCRNLGYDLKFTGTNLTQILVAGYLTDSKNTPYGLYRVNTGLDKIDYDYLLPSYKKYGLKNHQEYVQKYRLDQVLPAMGIRGYVSKQGQDFLYVWESAFRVLRIDSTSGEVISSFGQPVLSGKLLDKNISILKELRRGARYEEAANAQKALPHIKKIIATKDHVFLVYEAANTRTLRIQKYSFLGDYISDMSIPSSNSGNALGKAMWFNEEKYELWVFSNDNKIIAGYKIQK